MGMIVAYSVSHSHPIRVLLDGTAIPANLGGVGRYVDDLVPELVEQGVDLTMAVQERDAEHFATRLPSARIIPISRRFESRPAQRFFTPAIRRAIRRADALVVPSLATRDETIKYAGGDPSQFYVAYHGVDRSIFHPVSDAERERVKASLGLEGRDYIGFLGTLEPRKNVPNLVRGWVKAVSERPNPPALVLAGGKGWDEDIDPALASVPEHLTVLRPGYLPLEDLPGFLSGCVILAYPSIAEGFGLPVLEAMSCGAATLTTRLTSLPEVGGNAVAYCDIDPDSIASALTELLDDPARREALGAAAIPRADEFTWARAASVHIEAFRAAARS